MMSKSVHVLVVEKNCSNMCNRKMFHSQYFHYGCRSKVDEIIQ